MEPVRTSLCWMTKSHKRGTLGTKSSDASRPSKSGRHLAARRLARIRRVSLALVPLSDRLSLTRSGHTQVNVVAKQFMTALQNYTQVEKEYRQKQRARVERQFKIG